MSYGSHVALQATTRSCLPFAQVMPKYTQPAAAFAYDAPSYAAPPIISIALAVGCLAVEHSQAPEDYVCQIDHVSTHKQKRLT